MFRLRTSAVVVLGFIAQAGVMQASAESLPTFTGLAPSLSVAPTLYSWMSPEIASAWSAGYQGQGVTVTFVDDFSSANKFSGNLGAGVQTLRHGEWTSLETSLIAPSATIARQDFTSGTTVPLASGEFNAINLSYAMYAPAGYKVSQISWSAQESSIINYASGAAVIAKAAGNDGIAIGATNKSGYVDYLNVALIGKSSAIFVGALNSNGTTSNPASLASYSNKAGNNTTVQKNFLVVGVTGSTTGLYGTSFAAPVIAGYAAVLSSKFTTASPTSITNQLLNTARQDTVMNYKASTYGRGEASIARALAPVSIK